MRSETRTTQDIYLGQWKSSLSEAILSDPDHLAERIWKRDPSVWKSGPEYESRILDRLGWLSVAEQMRDISEHLERFSEEISGEGFRHAVLLGMGGSSLCPEVLAAVFGSRARFPKLLILDSTDPESIGALEKEINLQKTVFIVSSKSGRTIETLSHFSYFYQRLVRSGVRNPGHRFILITDAGSPLERLGAQEGVRKIFLNPSDIGGRYSALSLFGLVPASLLGGGVSPLLDSARSMAVACRRDSPANNPGLRLGLTLGKLSVAGADKLTFIMSRTLAPLAYWIEQLIAESTGKEGKGIIPVQGERLESPEVYGPDRVFAAIRTKRDSRTLFDRKTQALRAAGFPVITIILESNADLGGEFFRWEFATAVAGAVLQINPFDEPNVQESKDNTEKILKEYESSGDLPRLPSDAEDDEFRLSFGAATAPAVGARIDSFGGSGKRISEQLAGFLSLAGPSDYLALLVFGPRSKDSVFRLDAVRNQLRDMLHIPVLVGFGPRFLHSIGQLHKGGPASGMFIQITTKNSANIEIPNSKVSFGTLKSAQALGDFQSLDSRNLRVLRLDTKGNFLRRLESLETRTREALRLLARSKRKE